MKQENQTGITIFYSYAAEDESLRNELEKHLSVLRREGLLVSWHDRDIQAGSERQQEIDEHLNTASLILLLISPDFLASDYCYEVEMQRALERHKRGEVNVIPIILKPCDWQYTPLKDLQCLPRDGKPVIQWQDPDEAYENIVQGIRAVLESSEHLTSRTLPPAWPRLCNIPYAPNPFFTGQEALLRQLAETLQTGQPTALSQPQALSGLGGIGKTQLAVEYAHRHACSYQAILWVRADTHELLISGYTALAELLDLPQKEEEDQTIIVQAVERWLKTHREWLLIFDNADDLSLVSNFLRAPLGGHVLLTTRAHALGPLAQRIEVEAMSQEVGALLLLRRAGLIGRDASLEMSPSAQRATACAITEQLGGLPLALDQAGAYLEETGCSLTSYQQVYRQRQMELLSRPGSFPDYSSSVATTWTLCFEQIKQQSPAAIDLLCCCAFLHPDAIPEELFTSGSTRLGSCLYRMVSDTFAFNEAIRVLLAYSLIHRDPRAATLSIHRLVQAVILDTMSEEQQSQWRERVVQALDEILPEWVLQDWTQCGRYLPHVLVCVPWIEDERIPIPAAVSLLDKAGAYLLFRSQYRDAEPLLKRAIAMREQQLGAKHPDLVRGLNNLTNLYYRQAKYEQMERLAVRARAICEQSLGVEPPDTAKCLTMLGAAYWMQGKHKQAEFELVQALAIYEQCLGTEHTNIALCLVPLARIYGLQGKYSLAEASHLQAISIFEQQLGTHHHHTALHGWWLLAEHYHEQGKYEQAEPWFKQALEVCEQQLGTEHPETAACLSGLARVYHEQGKYEQAKPLFERLLEFAKQHPEVDKYAEAALALHGLAKFSQHEGKYEQAEDCYRHALAILEQRDGIIWLKKQKVQKDYATFLRLVGRDAEAAMLEADHETSGEGTH